MLQANSAGAILNGAPLDKGAGKAAKASEDDGVFSQEFEKQVKNSGEPVQGKGHKGSQDGTVAKQEQASPRAEANRAKEPEETAKGADVEGERQAGAVEGGKMLPQEIALAEGERADLSQNVEDAASESSQQSLSTELEAASLELFNAERMQRQELATEDSSSEQAAEGAVTVLPLLTPATSGDTAATASVSNGEEALSLRLRDVMAQRLFAGSGGEGGDVATGKQPRAELGALLHTTAVQGKGAQGFDSLLNTAAVNSAAGAPTVPTAQPAAAALPVAMTLAVPVQQQGWDQAMGERLVWMARGNIQQAQIQLNPRELGPIDIKISMQNDQTNVQFVAHHATTRDALEAAIPRLRDMMNEQGLNLGQADVSQHSFGGQGQQAAGGEHAGGDNLPAGIGGEEAEEALLPQHHASVIPGGVDYFA